MDTIQKFIKPEHHQAAEESIAQFLNGYRMHRERENSQKVPLQKQSRK